MTFECEDLREFGLVLAPSSSPDETPGSATLINNSDRAITALSVLWRYEDVKGRAWTGGHTSRPGILPGSQLVCSQNYRSKTALESITLSIDGAFFADGEFVGPGLYGLWETVTSESGIRSQAAHAAKNARSRGVPAADILEEIGRMTGPSTSHPAPPPHPGPMTPRKLAQIIRRAQHAVAREIDWQIQRPATSARWTGLRRRPTSNRPVSDGDRDLIRSN